MVLFANWKLEILLGGDLDLIEIRQLWPDLDFTSYMVKVIKWTKEISHDGK